MIFTQRQQKILEIVRNNAPITGETIAERLQVTRAALRSDLSILTMMGYLEARPRVGYSYREQEEQSGVMESVKHYQVGDIFSIPAVVNEDTSVYDAIVKLFTEDAGSLIVVDQAGCLSGMLSRKDLLRAVMGQGIQNIPVNLIMTRMPNIFYVRRKDPVLYALSLIVEHEVDSLPVVGSDEDENDYCVVGRISKTNLVRLMLDLTTGHGKGAEGNHE